MSMNSGFEVRSFKEIDSTNTYLIEEAKQGARDGLVATAAFQTAGRGRQGRTWEAPEGSALLVSALLRPVMSPDEAHLVATAVALSARAAIEQLSGLRASLKWPNDLVVEAAKIAGILGEIAPDAPGGSDGSIAVVVGIGINLSTE
ncbi:MAG: biotin--[acetyl-CoA-carboxylase] ligase, partial [Actinomycetota bacterium]